MKLRSQNLGFFELGESLNCQRRLRAADQRTRIGGESVAGPPPPSARTQTSKLSPRSWSGRARLIQGLLPSCRTCSSPVCTSRTITRYGSGRTSRTMRSVPRTKTSAVVRPLRDPRNASMCLERTKSPAREIEHRRTSAPNMRRFCRKSMPRLCKSLDAAIKGLFHAFAQAQLRAGSANAVLATARTSLILD